MESVVNERFGVLIKTLKLSQNEVAERLGVTHGTVNRWLNGHNEIRKSNAKAIAIEFNVNLAWLLEGTGEMFAEGGAKVETKVAGWRDEAYTKLEQYNESLKAEVAFLKSIVSGLLPMQKSFSIGAGVSGDFYENLSSLVRVRA